MTEQEIATALGRIEEKLDNNCTKLDEHMEKCGERDKEFTALRITVAVIKGNAALVAIFVSTLIGLGGWAIFLWGTGALKGG